MSRELGTHLILDLAFEKGYLEKRNQYDWMEALLSVVTAHKLEVLECAAWHFGVPGAVTVLLLLGTSHISIHVWPEHQSAAVDLYHCGTTALTEQDGSSIIAMLNAKHGTIRLLERHAHKEPSYAVDVH